MKKRICSLLLMLCVLSFGITASAGDVPESIMADDTSLLFFGEVTAFDPLEHTVTISPTKKIKGDVPLGESVTYQKPMIVGWDAEERSPVVGETYLVIGDKHEPRLFETTSTDTATLKIVGIEGMDMWEGFETYLNEGRYEQAEANRISGVDPEIAPYQSAEGDSPSMPEEDTSEPPFSIPTLAIGIGCGILIVFVGCIILRATRSKRRGRRK